MNTYVLTFNGHYSLYICVVTAKDELSAKNIACKSVENFSGFTNADYNIDIKQLPVTSNNNIEELLYINGYEE